MKYTSVIFDLDGTLVDTPAAIARTIMAVVAGTGHPTPRVEAVTATIGRPLEEAFRGFLPESAWDCVPDCVAAYRELYERTVVPNTEVFPGVVETLAACRAADLRLAVATTKLTGVAETTLVHCGLIGYFDAVLGGDKASRPKPDPELARAALAVLACPPEGALMVGDTTYDIEMGQAAGTHTCAVTYGVHSRAQLLATNPDHIIDRFSDLMKVLGLPRAPDSIDRIS